MRWFYEGRSCDTPDLGNPKRLTEKCKELGTFSGKIEFESQSLKQYFPDDDERPVVPRYIPSWEGHGSELARKYPLQLISPHPRFTFHCHYDKHTDWLDDIPVHRIKKDGYAWWPAASIPTMRLPAASTAVISCVFTTTGVRSLLRRGHRACPPGMCPLLCLFGQVRPSAAGPGGFRGQGWLRGCPHAVSYAVEERAGYDPEFLPYRDREMGGLREWPVMVC